MRYSVRKAYLSLAVVMLFACGMEYQVADMDFFYEIRNPAYAPGEGPAILLDEAHNNFHTMGGRYAPFVSLLERDGYVVRPGTSKITSELLNSCKIFVTSVPMSEDNRSAYTDDHP
ncbi:hypothetical protein ACFL6L_04240 [candidate division KSB1 bacterium]